MEGARPATRRPAENSTRPARRGAPARAGRRRGPATTIPMREASWKLAEDPPVELQPLQVAGHHRHHGDHRQCLRRNERHGEHEPERQGAPLRRPQPVSPKRPGPRRRDYGRSRWYSAAGGHMALQTIDVDQHLFESRTTWSDHIDPGQRADALSISDDDAGWPWLTWRGQHGSRPLEVPIPERSALIGEDRLRRLRGERAPTPFEELVPDVVPTRRRRAWRRSTSSGWTPRSCSRTTASCGSSGWRRTASHSGPTHGPTTASWPTSAARVPDDSSVWHTSCCTTRPGRWRRSGGCGPRASAWP